MLIIATMCIVQHPPAPVAEAKSLAVLKLKIFIIFAFISDQTYHWNTLVRWTGDELLATPVKFSQSSCKVQQFKGPPRMQFRKRSLSPESFSDIS